MLLLNCFIDFLEGGKEFYSIPPLLSIKVKIKFNYEDEVKIFEICTRDSIKMIAKRLAYELRLDFDEIELSTEDGCILGREYDDIVLKDS